ncbi:bifunctional hydroxy-methylpyrimidine kinase and hydroxy-phosphomethylpyrimidine kinase [Thiomonas arsenitoxydans]|uniref:hydroxymethylpyrimidine kinase n=1 Tax=Thiomonas arsenitoxydans (strain DSM 22701 / CIP 110005 / 3As) TaxID=426114 RepID=D6CLD4_THIA3|nr:bifunctional hydroxymethylpyrimidine kinase/phosphomethylpyrimidine kinase [Thiomonas arsenitoxydans]CQR45537.1 bifunctional hydroxy-methylpyrimidine kinase and hydroxy-phosphomethylpyrimidine kinase [Thiomonas sp. CB3]CAZ89362.1 Phosphomethylpyrimidine kinase (HMP-phosphate kinase) (HMP-P kinase) [Thiomonas arsenitoxydans]CQR33833.1 bifunctional hydroxy-methylpyrimidine kinase and hydroxy-phosphomethylpyrimidine kinase [Thiomonas arsenitoxydans]CQR35576.1 bifunctional hydroxy-methylpyrimidi
MNATEPLQDTPTVARYARVLSIAGSDSGGGAGIQADLKTMAALGCYGMTAITAITAQNTQGVRAIQALPPELLAQQIDAVVEDIGVDAVKIGMLHDVGVVRVVADAIRRHRFAHVVLDPVMVATSGDKLITESTVDRLVDELFPLATLITPNLDEAAWLLRLDTINADALEDTANRLHVLGAHAVLLKGGHLPGPQLTDLLRLPDGEVRRWEAPRIPTRNTHGTGCSLSSAIACYLALGETLTDAVAHGRDYVRKALLAGADMQLGHGHGPLNHGHAPLATKRLPL